MSRISTAWCDNTMLHTWATNLITSYCHDAESLSLQRVLNIQCLFVDQSGNVMRVYGFYVIATNLVESDERFGVNSYDRQERSVTGEELREKSQEHRSDFLVERDVTRALWR